MGPCASDAATDASRGAASTEGQHGVSGPGRPFDRSVSVRVITSILDSFPLTIVNASIIVDQSIPVNAMGGFHVARVQLALNVTDLEAAVEFYSSLFGTGPAKRRPGYANYAIAAPPLKLVLIEDPSGRETGWPGPSTTWASKWTPPPRSGTPPVGGTKTVWRRPSRRRHVLLRRAGQGLGQRSRRRPLGGLHGVGRRHRRHRHGLLDRDMWPIRPGSRWAPRAVRLSLRPRAVDAPAARVGPGERDRCAGGSSPHPPAWAAGCWPRRSGACSSPPWWSGRASPRRGSPRAATGLAAARERRGHRGRALRHHLDVRARVRRALQPGGLAGRRLVRWHRLAHGLRLSAGPGGRVRWWCGRGQPHVLRGRR